MGHQIKRQINVRTADCVLVVDDVYVVGGKMERRGTEEERNLIIHTTNNLNAIRQMPHDSGSVRTGSEALTSAGGSPYKVLLHTALTAGPVAMGKASR